MGTNLLKACLIALLIVSAMAAGAHAEMYSFVDAKGVRHFSNVPNDRRYAKVEWVKSREMRMPTPRYVDPQAFEGYLREVGEHYRLDPMLIKAVIKAESNFDCLAVSPKGAQGLMQLMPGTARDMRVFDSFDPRQNIRGGARYLRKMLNLFEEDIALALAAYNAGPEAVKNYGAVPDYPETTAYVERVLRHYKRYQTVAAFSRGG
ncbi:MAG: hypothetical protein BM485_00335 [Desulfobulbaceae bacterium DB1]|nr:MAG: hypothetical protein BM485_00335 [Desulfobulbaceae bacterium DB1]